MENPNQRFHNKIGSEYDHFRLASPYHDEIQKSVCAELKPNANPTRERRVIEIGFGTGFTSHGILSADEGIHLIGVDNEPDMLPQAERALSSFPHDRFELTTDDALSFMRTQADGSADDVVSVFVIHNMPQEYKRELLREIFRVLKPGGSFIDGDKIADNDPKRHQAHLDWQIEQFDVFEGMNRPDLKHEWTDHYREDEQPDKIMVEDEFLTTLKDIGFQQVNLVNRWQMDALVVARK